MEETINLALIYGSAREGRFADTIVDWAMEQITADSRFEVQLIDPATMAPPAWHVREDTPERRELAERIGKADAFLVVTPEYNRGYPAPLKHLIDAVYSEWQAKPVAFISYGGISGGLRAVEQLRQVFAELHAVTIRDSVALPNAWTLFDDAGQMKEPEGPGKTLAFVLNRLHWWAAALHRGRQAMSYGEKAA
ncbi:NADPH-dependent FMN reductase [Pedomonas mirosovicensis]|uniref:NADPH-dependent FMN reductase n=1 Tax=Pedomonas mirosovicensis TaxID=2908641 RepID=UPI0021690EED|nr:NAD(P)H-dependent oxidoreductase [Pedomonas mirosovicensis]MCH8685035.1 NAD(P)H-dependent oxidoreductase [Pedomonas mirosovicensis]